MPRITSPFLVLAATAMAAAVAGGPLQAEAADSARPALDGKDPLRAPSPSSAPAILGAAVPDDGAADSRGATAAAPTGADSAAFGPDGDSARPSRSSGPVVSVDDVEVLEGDSGTTLLWFVIRIPEPADGDEFVDIEVVPGTATEDGDYVHRHGGRFYEDRLSFFRGATSASYAVSVVGDETNEPDETLFLNVTRASGLRLAEDRQGEGRILNDDGPRASIQGGAVDEGGYGDSNVLPFTVSLSEAPGRETRVVYEAAGGTAVAGRDYSAPSGVVVFDADERERTVSVPVVGDHRYSPDETVVLRLLDDSDAPLSASSSATGVIRNDDPEPRLAFDSVNVEVLESASGTRTEVSAGVAVWTPSEDPVFLGYETVSGTALGGEDYEAATGTVVFGDVGRQHLSVFVLDDALSEEDEEFSVRLSDPGGVGLLAHGPTEIRVRILDDDFVDVVVGGARAVEGVGAELVFPVALAEPAGRDVSLRYSFSSAGVADAALPGEDYLGVSTSRFVIPSGATSTELVILVLDDALAEGDERFEFKISSRSPRVRVSGPVIGVIEDDDLFLRAREPVPVDEGGAGNTGTLSFVVTAGGVLRVPVSFSYVVEDGTARAADGDYVAASGTVAFPLGATSTTVDVSVLGDDLVEPDETLFFRLTGAAGADFDASPVAGVVRSDDFAFSIDSPSPVLEGESGTTAGMDFAVRLSSPSSRETRVRYVVRGGTAQVPGDVVPKTGTLVFSPGETEETLTVLVRGDDVSEPDETFHVVLFEPVGAHLGSATATGMIRNDDNRVVFVPFEVVEGSGFRTREGVLRFSVEPPASHEVSFGYGTFPGTARYRDGDYSLIDGAFVRLPAGWVPPSDAAGLSVGIGSDRLHEEDETFYFRFWDPVGAVLDASEVPVVILDDDPPPVVSFGSPSVDEGDLGATTTLVFTASLSVRSGVDARVPYAVSGGATGTLVFAPGETEASFGVVVVGDDVFELDERVVVSFSESPHAVLATSTAVGIVRDDDPMPLVSVVAVDGFVHEGMDAVFVVSLSGPSFWPTVVSYGLGGTATSGPDYVAPSGMVSVPAGATSVVVRVGMLEDGVAEGEEDLVLTLLGADRVGVDPDGGSARVTVLDGRMPVLSMLPARVMEGDAGDRNRLVFRAALDVPSSRPVRAAGLLVPGSATPGEDYDAPRFSRFIVEVVPGDLSTSFVLSVTGDDVVEPDEEVFFVLSDPVGAVLGTATGTGTIVDDDGPFFSAHGGEVVEGDSGRVVLRLRVVLSEPLEEMAWVVREIVDGSAVFGEDYDHPFPRVTEVFAPGVVERFVDVDVWGDTLHAPDEDFFLRLSEPAGARLSASSTARGVIRNDDAAPVLRVEGSLSEVEDPAYAGRGWETVSVVPEGGSGEESEGAFQVLLRGRSEVPVSVRYRTEDVDAVAGVDYGHVEGELVFPDGRHENREVVVPVFGNDVPEGDRGFVVLLEDPTGGAVISPARGRALGVVRDDDVRVSVGDADPVVEGHAGSTTTMFFPLTLSRPSTGEVRVLYSVTGNLSDGEARYSQDFQSSSKVLASFPPGSTSTFLRAVVIGDDVGEGNEEIEIDLLRVFGGVKGRVHGYGTIIDDDAPNMVSVQGGGGLGARSFVSESATTTGHVFHFVLDRPAVFPVYVRYEYGGTAERRVDYEASNLGSRVIPVGGTSTSVTIFPLDDNELEGSESVTVSLVSVENGVPDPAFSTATCWIDDDDVAVRVAGPEFVDEPLLLGSATTAVLRVTLDEPVQRAVHVWYELGGTAEKGVDYTFDPPQGPKGRLLFLPRKTEVEVPFRVLGDGLPEGEETIVLRLTESNGPTGIADRETVLRIRDDVGFLMPSVDSPSVVEGAGPLVFRLSLDRPLEVDFDLSYEVSGGTALPGVDFVAGTGTAVVPAGATSTMVEVEVLDDDLYTGGGTVVLALLGSFAGVSGTGVVLEDDPVPVLSVSPSSIGEGDATSTWAFALGLDRVSGVDVRVPWSLGGGTASSGVDYEGATGTVVIPAGSRYGAATTTLYGDAVYELDETVVFSLGRVEGADVHVREVLGTIRNDDDPPRIRTRSMDFVEGLDAMAEVVLVVEGPTEVPVSLDYATGDHDAVAGMDYVAASGSLVFLPGEREKTVRFGIIDDDLHESQERVDLDLRNVVGASWNSLASADILDDDAPPVLTLSPGEVVEGSGGATSTLSFRVSLSEVSGRVTNARYVLRDGTAVAGEDYVDAPGYLVLWSGATSTTLDVVVIGDDVDEGDEVFSLALLGLNGAATTSLEATGTIRDDDDPPVVSVSGGGGIVESATTTFTVSLSEVSSFPVEVSYDVGGTAAHATDYVPLPGMVVVPAGERSASIGLVTVHDEYVEDDETVILTLTGAVNASVDVLGASSTVVIRDDDVLVVTVGDGGPVTEGVGDLVFPVTVSGSSTVDVVFPFRVIGGKATRDVDYRVPLEEVVVPAGSGGTEIRFPVHNDDVPEAEEDVFLDFTSAGRVRFSRSGARGRIVDDDVPEVVFSMADVVEGSGGGTTSLVLHVAFSEPLPAPFHVIWESAGGTAKFGEDYALIADLSDIPTGATSYAFMIPVIADDVPEPDETLRIRLLTQGPASVSQRYVQARILNDDAGLSVSGSSVGEGDSGKTRELSFLAGLAHPILDDVRFGYRVVGGTAAEGADYVALPAGEVVIPAGERSVWVPVSVLGDDAPELDETVVLGLEDLSGLGIASATGTGVIYNDDVPVLTVSALPGSVVEGASGSSTPVVFRAVLDGPVSREVRVRYLLRTGRDDDPLRNAMLHSDYFPADCDPLLPCSVSGFFRFAPGQTERDFVVNVVGDSRDEPDEGFLLVLSNASGAVLGTTEVPVVIEDDDMASVSAALFQRPIPEGDSGTRRMAFQFRFTNLLWRDGVSVLYGFGGTAVLGEDFEVVGDPMIAPGLWEARFGVSNAVYRHVRVNVLGDRDVEPDETIVLRILGARGIALGSATSATGTVLNDDDVVLSVVDSEAGEGDGELGFLVLLSGPVEEEVSFAYGTVASDGTAVVGVDYAAVSGQGAVPAGATGTRVAVPVFDDAVMDGGRTVVLGISDIVSDAPVSLGVSRATGTIRDDETPELLRVSIGDGEVLEGASGTTASLVLPVFLSATSSDEVRVRYAAFTGTAHGSDYEEFSSREIVFAPGETEGEAVVVVTGDDDYAPDEHLEVRLRDPSGVLLGVWKAKGWIRNDDPMPLLFAEDARVREGDGDGRHERTFRIRMEGRSESWLQVEYEGVPGGTAIPDLDYVRPNSSVVFGDPGFIDARVRVIGDEDSEGDETFLVVLSDTRHAKIVAATSTITIVDDDAAVFVDDVEVVEGAFGERTTLSFPVRLTVPSRETVRVDYEVVPGSAAAGRDYERKRPGVLVFAPGATTTFVDVVVLGDDVDEPDELFLLVLSDPRGAVLADSAGDGIIRDDDGVPVVTAFGPGSPFAEEDGGSAGLPFTFVLSEASGFPVSIPYSFAGTASPGEDYVASTGTLVIPAGATSTGVLVTVLDDDLSELPESVFPVFGGVVNGVAGGVVPAVLVDRDTPSLSVSPAEVPEGDDGERDLVFRLVLSNPRVEPVEVIYAVVGDTATAGTDFRPASGRAVFSAFATSTEVGVRVFGDVRPEVDEVVVLTADGVLVGLATTTGTILNDDDPAVVSLSPGGPSVVEGATGTVPMAFDMGVSVPVAEVLRVSYDIGGTAASGADYVAPSGIVEVPAGAVSAIVAVDILGDLEVEREETVELVLTGVDSRFAVVDDTPVSGTIINDDVPLVSFREGTAVSEGSASGTLVFVLELSSPPVDEVRVPYASVGGTATAGMDYAPVSGTAVFPAGVAEFTIPVILLEDDLDELDETVVLEAMSVEGTLPGVRMRAAGTILDDDGPSAVSVRGGGEVLEGGAGGEALLPFVFLLDRPSGLPVAVDYRSGGSAGRLVFPLGATSSVVDVAVPGDDVVEPDETVVVVITGVENGVFGSATSATGRVIDDDLPILSLRGAEVSEGDSGTTTLVFTAFLSEAALGDVTASYAVSGGTASAGSDYADPGSGSLVIRAGAMSTTVGIPVFGDGTVEGDETVELALSSVAGAGEGILSASGVIRNDDLPVVSLSGGSVAEGHRGAAAPLVFTARLSQPPAGEVRVNWSTAGGTATAGTDFTPANGTLVFEAGHSVRTFAVPVTGDDVLERDETVEVKLSGVLGAETGTSTAAGVIVNDDDASVSIGGAEVVEGVSGATATLVFPVRVDPPLFEGASGVRWRTVDGGTAEPGVDYVVSSGALPFAPGVGTAEVRVTILGDGGNEPDETVLVELFDPGPGVALSGGPATGTIRDDDAPFVSLFGGGATEPETGTADLVFTVRLSEVSVRDVHVDYGVVGGTASEGVDYRLSPGTLVIPAGDREAVFVALVVADNEVELDETVRMGLSRPVGARAGTSTAAGVIRDVDESVFAVGSPEVVEGASGTTAALVFPVTLTPPLSSGTGTVGWRVAAADGDAAAGADFASASGTLSFGRGVGERTVSVAVNGDDVDEFDETVVVVLEDPGPRTVLGTARGTGVIRDDDPAPALSLSSAGVAEGDAGTSSLVFTARLGAASAKEVTAGYRDAGTGTADAGVDYERFPAGVIAFAPGEEERRFAVAVRGDTAYEADETVVVELFDPVHAALAAGTAAGAVRDDDPPRLGVRAAEVPEGAAGATTSLVFAVRLEGPARSEVTVRFAVEGGTATAGEDFAAPPAGVLTIPAGGVSSAVAVTVLGDDQEESDETVLLLLSEAVNAVLATSSAAGVILDDDGSLGGLGIASPGVLSIGPAEVAEGAPGGSADLVFRVRLDPAASSEVRVAWATRDGTAAAGEDYDAATGTLAFAPGDTERTIAVAVRGDSIGEGDETVLVALGEVTGPAAVGTSTAAGTILDDDGSPGDPGAAPPGVLSIGPAEVDEGAPGESADLVFRVHLDPAASSEVRVAWATRDGTATAGEDYDAAAGTLAFAPGDTERTIAVSVRGDSVGEGDETVLVALGDATGPAAVGTSTATGTILDDDEDFGVPGPDLVPAGPGGVRISVAAPVHGGVGEGHDGDRTPMRFPVLLSGPAPGTITATGVFEGTAAAGADYEIPSGRVTLAPGATSTAFEVVVLGDRLEEGDETVAVRLVAATGDAALDGAPATGVIRDDDDPPSALSLPRASVLSPATMMEGGGGSVRALTFTMVLDRAAEAPVTADYATAGGAAAAGEDFLPSSGTLVIPAGATSTTMEVTVLGDDAFEADEAFFVEFTNLAGASFGSAVDPASGRAAPVASMRTTTVIMNDDAPGLSVSSDGVREGRAGATSTLVFVLSIPGPAPAPVVVPYSVRGGTARAGEDFAAVSGGTATIPVGESSVAVGVPVFGDDVFERDETVVLEVGAVRGATAAEREAEGLILRDEPGLTVGAGEAVEGASGTTAAIMFPVTLDRAASGTVAVAWATRDGTATAGEDYAAAAGTLSFASGELSGTVRVSVIGDDIVEPDETFLVALSAPSGGAGILAAEAAGTIRDDDRPGPELRTVALVRALAGFSGAVGADVAGFVRERAAGVRDSYAVVGGRVVDGVQSVAGLLGVGDTPEGLLRDAERVLRAGGGLRDFLRPPDGTALAGRTRFALSWGGGGPSYAMWARGHHTSFGSDFDGLEMDGEVAAGSFGVDMFSPRSGLLAGLAVRRAEGGADYAFGEGGPEGRVETALTSLHPYLHWTSPSGLGLWGAAGYGAGEARAGDDAGDIAMRMAAVGARGPLAGGGMHDVALKLDAFVVGMSAADDGIFAGTEADTSRVRVALEGRTSAAYGAGEFTARFDLGARHDGGDGVRGGGLDAGFGLAWDSLGGGLDMSGQGSLVLDHEEESLREWSLGLGLAWDPGVRGRGGSLSLSPAWGTRDGGGARLDARLGYGIGIPGGGVEVFGEFGQERVGRRLRLGADFRPGDRDGLRAGVYGEHRRGDREVGVEAGIGF